MGYPQFQYAESIDYQTYIGSPTLDLSVGTMIDSDLKRTSSPPHVVARFSPPQLHRFLTDDKSSFFTAPVVEPVLPGPVLPSSLLHRGNSPSFSHSSSTCSSALSPARESDFYQPHSPPSPTDAAPTSAYINQHDSYGYRSHLYEFTGLGTEACVKPMDVNPYQETPQGYYDDQCPLSSFRSYSMSSDGSIVNAEKHIPCDQLHMPRQMSPESFSVADIKEEICVPDARGTRPPFDQDIESVSGEEIDPPTLKYEAEDEEYIPDRKQKRATPSPSRSGKGRKRPGSASPVVDVKRVKVEDVDSVVKGRITKPALPGTKGSFACPQCPNSKIAFKDEHGLENHIKKQHTRPFTCIFDFAGCHSTFASKNEWKRHCASQHLILNYWVCQEEQCAKVSNSPHSPSRATSSRNRGNASRLQHRQCPSNLPDGTIFNRKDLYTQHLRRMHAPSSLKKQGKQKKGLPNWEERERTYQEEALRTRCHLPNHMQCPAANCNHRFDGKNAWDDRMEHVAKHLERASAGSEPLIKFGGDGDRTLMDWATSPDVSIIRKTENGQWELQNPLKARPVARRSMPVIEDEDMDAEGEDE
ncbi:hypothetical protein F4778DRAFT_158995 [Xylariomycetidae sp. FL2044]|nr:hypothetical protein F4778DRAFT_158995 [Xylariomycetidae sp. FL2044]